MSFGIVWLFPTNVEQYSQEITVRFSLKVYETVFCSAFSLYNDENQKRPRKAFNLYSGEKESDHEGTRTLSLPIRSRTPYPLGHAASQMKENDL